MAVAATAALLVTGCAVSGSPEVDASFGDGLRGLKASQLIDPTSPTRNAGTVGKTAGRNTRDSVDRMGEDYRTPPPTTILMGGGGTRN